MLVDTLQGQMVHSFYPVSRSQLVLLCLQNTRIVQYFVVVKFWVFYDLDELDSKKETSDGWEI